MLEIGLKHTSELTVSEGLTAIQMGSGDMPVLATPAMMALMENAAMLAVADELPEGCTTVGGHIESSHLRPSKIGDKVAATAEVSKVDGKKIEFKVAAYSGETLLGEGTHLRFIVDRERFMSKLGGPAGLLPPCGRDSNSRRTCRATSAVLAGRCTSPAAVLPASRPGGPCRRWDCGI